MKISLLNLLAAALMFFAVLSCAKEDRVNLMVQQEKSIESYAATFSQNRVEVSDFVWRVVLDEGSEEITAQQGDSLIFEYAAYLFSSGKGFLFSTNIRSIATAAGITQDENIFYPRRIRVGKGELLPGLDIGLQGVRKGERCYVIFSARKGFGPVQIGLVPKMSSLIYEVWVRDVKKN